MIYLKFLTLVLLVAMDINISSACFCGDGNVSPHQRFCNSEIVIKFRVAQVRCLFPPWMFDHDQMGNETFVDFPRSVELTKENQHDRSFSVSKEVSPREMATMASPCYQYHYRIQILKVFKGEFLENSYITFKAPAGDSCSTQLDLKESYYVMTNNRSLGIDSCTWSVKANEELSTMLDDKMMENFGCGCEECNFCSGGVYGSLICPGGRNSSCDVIPRRRFGLNHLVGRACRRNETGVCEWKLIGDETNALNWFYPRPDPPSDTVREVQGHGFMETSQSRGYDGPRSDTVYDERIRLRRLRGQDYEIADTPSRGYGGPPAPRGAVYDDRMVPHQGIIDHQGDTVEYVITDAAEGNEVSSGTVQDSTVKEIHPTINYEKTSNPTIKYVYG